MRVAMEMWVAVKVRVAVEVRVVVHVRVCRCGGGEVAVMVKVTVWWWS